MTRVALAICTWNRRSILRGTLEAVARLDTHGIDWWEVLVVDNNSTDDTREVVRSFEGVLPIRYVFEPRQGIAFARNRVLTEARGDLLICLDDDCRPDRELLTSYAAANREWPEAALFSGVIEPEFEKAPPRWIAENLDVLAPVYGMLNRTGPARRLAPNESLFSGNMAARAAVIREYGFNTALGRVGTDRLGGEETELFVRMLGDGWDAIWVPHARVRHFISQSCIGADYIRRTFWAEGRLSARLDSGKNVAMVCGIPRWALRAWFEATMASVLWARLDSRRWLQAWTRRVMLQGLMFESRQKRHAGVAHANAK